MSYQRPKTKVSNKGKALGCGCMVALVVAVMLGIGLGVSASGKSTERPPAGLRIPSREGLVFTGQVKGILKQGLNARAVSTKDPQPPSGFGPFSATQCTDSKDEWEADIYGVVGGVAISLRVSIDTTSDAGLSVVGTQELATKYSPQVVLIGAAGRYDSDDNLEGTSLDLEYPVEGSATLTVDPNREAGTMNIGLTDGPFGSDVKETIRGAWTCGPVSLPRLPLHTATKPQRKRGTVKVAPKRKIQVSHPSAPAVPGGAMALCNDGTYSFSQHHRGTCSHHHGVAQWFR